ncbi:RcnB family protein [Ferrovibrio xuzhouensis]|uniref:RcnB family protein n=1 Tax=Ferrovibrio xuzhouensis TaxID=1576914 RepID=A0ABV7VF57_9PROT
MTSTRPFASALAFTIALSVALPAFADPPPGKGRGHEDYRRDEHRESHERGPEHDPDRGSSVNINIEFHDNDRVAVRDYYADLGRHGHCPPGLAKKHDRCMPPGQAKRWEIGRPLPRDVVYYNLPPELVMHLSPPPAGYRYVRVSSDILMIAAGTGLVAAAIQDLAYIQ